jgi:hypothetical protein
MTFQMNAGAVRRFAKAMRFGAWLQSITERMTPAPFRLVQIGSAYWQSKALWRRSWTWRLSWERQP